MRLQSKILLEHTASIHISYNRSILITIYYPDLGHIYPSTSVQQPTMPPFQPSYPRLIDSSASSLMTSHSRSNLPLQRRWSSCSYYDTSCDTHRTILLSIIIAVVVLKVLIVTLLCVRHHRRKAARQRQPIQPGLSHAGQANTLKQIKLNEQQGGVYYGYGGNALMVNGVEAPPPTYSPPNNANKDTTPEVQRVV